MVDENVSKGTRVRKPLTVEHSAIAPYQHTLEEYIDLADK